MEWQTFRIAKLAISEAMHGLDTGDLVENTHVQYNTLEVEWEICARFA